MGNKEHRYFTGFAFQHREFFPLLAEHGVAGRSSKQEGRFVVRENKFIELGEDEKPAQGEYLWKLKPDWGNVGRHCLLEAVQADVLAEALQMSSGDREELIVAAFLHDFAKREEIKGMKKADAQSYLAVEDALETAAKEHMISWLRKQNYSQEKAERVAAIAGAAGDLYSIVRMEKTDVTLSEMIMQYVDGITQNEEITSIAERVALNKQRYADLDRLWQERSGEKYSDAQERVLTNIEREIVKRLGIGDSSSLPEFIKTKIQKRVDAAGD